MSFQKIGLSLLSLLIFISLTNGQTPFIARVWTNSRPATGDLYISLSCDGTTFSGFSQFPIDANGVRDYSINFDSVPCDETALAKVRLGWLGSSDGVETSLKGLRIMDPSYSSAKSASTRSDTLRNFGQTCTTTMDNAGCCVAECDLDTASTATCTFTSQDPCNRYLGLPFVNGTSTMDFDTTSADDDDDSSFGFRYEYGFGLIATLLSLIFY